LPVDFPLSEVASLLESFRPALTHSLIMALNFRMRREARGTVVVPRLAAELVSQPVP
jgi:hypothetical protein